MHIGPINDKLKAQSKPNIEQDIPPGTTYDQVGIFNSSISESNKSESVAPTMPPQEYNVSFADLLINPPSIVHTDQSTPEIEIIEECSEEEEEIPEEENCTDETKETDKNIDIHVQKIVNGKNVSFIYNRANMEAYAITNSFKGHFKSIPEIINKTPEDRSQTETQLLQEFEIMIDSVIDAGNEYGVDPNAIFAIIHKEVGFAGMGKRVAGKNGKGYMQLTTIAIKDIFYRPSLYGPEVSELLSSRGFNLDCTKSERDKTVAKVMYYLRQNNDADFNIRLGAIVLRRQLEKANGNIAKAAYNYNGNPKADINNPKKQVREIYSEKVLKYYNQLCSYKLI